MIQNFAGSSSGQRNPRESPGFVKAAGRVRILKYGHFPVAGDGQNICFLHPQGSRISAVKAGGEQFYGPALQGCAVNNGLPVG